MRRSIFACGLLLALAGIPSAVAAAAGGNEPLAAVAAAAGGNGPLAAVARHVAQARANSIDYWNDRAVRAEAATTRWLTVVRGRPPQHASHTSQANSPQTAQDTARAWHRRAIAAWRLATHPPHRRAWFCIHHREGSWTDPDAPYWGGLQMDYSFQSAYGAWLLKHKGTANHWTPLAQIWAAVRAWRVRGFEPWAGTAHACGVY